MPTLIAVCCRTPGLPSTSAYAQFISGISRSASTSAKPMRWVNDTLPPRARARWLLRTMRLSMSSLAGTARTLVAVGTARLASMLTTTREDGPRSRTPSSRRAPASAGPAGARRRGAAWRRRAAVAGGGLRRRRAAGAAAAVCGAGGVWSRGPSRGLLGGGLGGLVGGGRGGLRRRARRAPRRASAAGAAAAAAAALGLSGAARSPRGLRGRLRPPRPSSRAEGARGPAVLVGGRRRRRRRRPWGCRRRTPATRARRCSGPCGRPPAAPARATRWARSPSSGRLPGSAVARRVSPSSDRGAGICPPGASLDPASGHVAAQRGPPAERAERPGPGEQDEQAAPPRQQPGPVNPSTTAVEALVSR